MANELTWIRIQDRLPEKYDKVITLLYTNKGDERAKICLNSIQCFNHQNPDGSITELYHWDNENLRVTHWLDGDLPKIPKSSQG